MNRMPLEYEIAQIGEKMVNCDRKCSGIVNDKAIGRPPRCLFLEAGDEGRDQIKPGIIVVGLNPGNAEETEATYYTQNDKVDYSYSKTVDYWKEELKDKHPYYLRLKSFIALLGVTGPILWTELVKCESCKSKGIKEALNIKRHTQTFRLCSSLYLAKELEVTSKDWPLIGVGFLSYETLAFLYPSRTVIGVPHPTGSRGHFFKLMKKISDDQGFQARLPTLNSGSATWLTEDSLSK